MVAVGLGNIEICWLHAQRLLLRSRARFSLSHDGPAVWHPPPHDLPGVAARAVLTVRARDRIAVVVGRRRAPPRVHRPIARVVNAVGVISRYDGAVLKLDRARVAAVATPRVPGEQDGLVQHKARPAVHGAHGLTAVGKLAVAVEEEDAAVAQPQRVGSSRLEHAEPGGHGVGERPAPVVRVELVRGVARLGAERRALSARHQRHELRTALQLRSTGTSHPK